MLLTNEQLLEIRQIIRDRHLAFVINTVGIDAVAPEILEDLKTKGLVNVSVRSIEDAYLYGQLLAQADDPKLAKMGYDEFKQHIQKNPIPLSDEEKRAVQFAQQQAGQFVVGLGNRVDARTGQILIEADAQLRAQTRGKIRDETARNIAERKTVKQLKSKLGWETKDWARDWDRIAITEKHTAMQRGVADNLAETHGPDVRVTKRPTPDACFTAGTEITTNRGLIPIEEVRVGDKVLTHKMRWRRVTHLMRRHYVGKVYGFNGRVCHMTENHPLLANLNWCRADAIECGDYLVGVGSVRESKNNPTRVDEEHFLCNVSGTSSSPRVPVPSVQLYSYLQMRDSDIDVEFVDSHFQNGFKICEGLAQLDRFCSGRRERSLSSFSLSSLSLWGTRLFSRLLGSFRECVPFFLGHTTVPAFSTGRLCGDFPTPFQKSSLYNPATDPEFVGDGLHGVLSRSIEFTSLGFRNMRTGISHKAYLEKVSTYATEHFSGIVYNFEVEDDHSYVADGLVVHNCEHCKRLYLGPDGAPRIFKLSTLEANGLNNFGRKVKDWKPVVGATHPHCLCQLIRIPEGWGFNELGQLVPNGDLGVFHEDIEDFQKSYRGQRELQKAWALEGHVEFQGLAIAIENQVGSSRKWTDADGNEGETVMRYAYGYIEGTNGADEDEVDVFLGPDPNSQFAYIVHQQNPSNGMYDEDKVMLGFSSQAAAKFAYLEHYDKPEFFVSISPMGMDQFKQWVGGTVMPEPFQKSAEPQERFVILEKSGPFIGPKGGKWADAQHTIPWREESKPKTLKEFTQKAVGALKRAGLKASRYQPKKGIRESGFKISKVPGFKLPGFQWETWGHESDQEVQAKIKQSVQALEAAGFGVKEVVPGGGMFRLWWQGTEKKNEPPSKQLSKSYELQSSGNVPNYVGAASSPAGKRAPGSGNAAFNRKVGTKKIPAPKVENLSPTPREFLESNCEAREGHKRDIEDMVFQNPWPPGKLAERFVIPDLDPYGVPRDPDEVKKNRDLADKEIREKQGHPNKAEVEDGPNQERKHG